MCKAKTKILLLAWLCLGLGIIGVNVPTILHAHAAYLESTNEEKKEEPVDQEETDEYKEYEEGDNKNHFLLHLGFTTTHFIPSYCLRFIPYHEDFIFRSVGTILSNCPLYLLYGQLRIDC